LKAACKQHAVVHLYSITTKRSNYKMGVLLHCGKSSTREGGGRWEKQIKRVGGSAPFLKHGGEKRWKEVKHSNLHICTLCW
jgi:hypothetical protein